MGQVELPAAPALLSCPKCGSDNTQLLAQYVRAGTFTSEGVIVGGATAGLGGGLTQGTTINEIIKRNPEPKKPAIGCLLLVGLFATIFSALLGPIGVVASLSLFGWMIWSGTKGAGKMRYQAALTEFESKWICHRCGEVFVPQSLNEASG